MKLGSRFPHLAPVMLCVVAVVALAAAGCAPAPARAPQPVVVETVVVEKAVEAGMARPAAAPPIPTPPPVPKNLDMAQGEERMLIRTAELNISVQDTEKAAEGAKAIANALGGYVADAQIYQQGEQKFARITLRIPAEDFETALSQLKGLAVEVLRESTHGEDVTEEYVDLQARLRNLELTEKELQQLLTEVRERTQKAEDVLAVYRELTEVRGQIEQLKGRMQYLERRVDFATIALSISPHELSKPVVEPGWKPLVTLREAGRSLVKALQWLADALIWVVVFLLPILVILAIPIVLLVLLIRYLVRRRKSRAL
ncbi:MAG: DUF4349 domain-containing protein [Anaerolineae bacterium]